MGLQELEYVFVNMQSERDHLLRYQTIALMISRLALVCRHLLFTRMRRVLYGVCDYYSIHTTDKRLAV